MAKTTETTIVQFYRKEERKDLKKKIFNTIVQFCRKEEGRIFVKKKIKLTFPSTLTDVIISGQKRPTGECGFLN